MKEVKLSEEKMIKFFKKVGLVLPRYNKFLFCNKLNKTSYTIALAIKAKKPVVINLKKEFNNWKAEYEKKGKTIKLKRIKDINESDLSVEIKKTTHTEKGLQVEFNIKVGAKSKTLTHLILPIPSIIDEKEKAYGSPEDNFFVIDQLERILEETSSCDKGFMVRQFFAGVFRKIGRIITGDAMILEHYIDIIGYCEIMVRFIKKGEELNGILYNK